MLMALRFEPSRFFPKKAKPLPLRKNLLGSKRKAINIYFTSIMKACLESTIEPSPSIWHHMAILMCDVYYHPSATQDVWL